MYFEVTVESAERGLPKAFRSRTGKKQPDKTELNFYASDRVEARAMFERVLDMMGVATVEETLSQAAGLKPGPYDE